MAKKLKMIKKMEVIESDSTLELTVSKNGGPVSTAVEVGSTGDDDESFSDQELTPGPARKNLDSSNSYSLVWTGAFVAEGSARLRVVVGNDSKNMTVNGKAGDVFFRVVMIP